MRTPDNEVTLSRGSIVVTLKHSTSREALEQNSSLFEEKLLSFGVSICTIETLYAYLTMLVRLSSLWQLGWKLSVNHHTSRVVDEYIHQPTLMGIIAYVLRNPCPWATEV